jgi:large repetitive protein
MKKIYFVLFSFILIVFGRVSAQTVTYSYTGAVQTFTVPACITELQVDVRGAEGQGNADNLLLGGLGGRIQGTMTVTPGEVLDIYVGGGGLGNSINGGFNGGGAGGLSYQDWPEWQPSPACPSADGGGGGGASDIRITPYALANRVIVAGGGGGTGGNRMVGCGPGAGGGGGGGYYGGGGGGGYSGLPGVGGSQVAGGAAGTSPGCSIYGGLPGTAGVLGNGGAGGGAPGNDQGGSANGCQGGGGGTTTGGTGVNCTTGGCPGTWSGGSGGGGSNYSAPCPAVVAVTQSQGFQSGNGEVIITEICNAPVWTAWDSVIQPSCGINNGKIYIKAENGTAPYTYTWTPNVSSTSSATALSAGTYTIVVNDAGCNTSTFIVTLTSTSLTVAGNVIANEPCNGNCVGSANEIITGGAAPFTYLWTLGGQTTATATGLCVGTYTVSVTDANGCIGTATVTITAPPLLTASITSVNELCNGGNNASATVTAGGGTPAYTYLWTPGNQTNATATGLTVGSYTVTVADNNGCSATAVVVISAPPPLTAAITASTNVSCNPGNNGTATVTAGGGTPNYTYLWAPNGGTNATGTGLSAGIYTVTVTDANGCTATATVTITEPTPLTATMGIPTNVSCSGGNNGSATVTANGGTPAYTYLWAPNGGTNSTGTGLSAGNYTVTVTDANGCTATAAVIITEPNPLTTTISFTQATCNLPNGSSTVVATGGTPAYTYFWIPNGQTNATATGLSAGTYSVVVTDAQGCTATATVNVTEPTAVNASITAITEVSCFGGTNASLTVTAIDGTAPYTYLWNPTGQTNATATGLTAGVYTVSVWDNNGCLVTVIQTVTQPTLLTATISATTNVSCSGGANGTSNVSAAGGTPNYTYLWVPNGGTDSTGTGLSAGIYTVTVTDANGCMATATVTITAPTPVTANITATTNVSCNGAADASSTVTPGGGTPGYTYLWTPGNQTNATATGLSALSYTVTVTDANGCTATATVTITEPPVLTASATFTQASCNLNNGSATVLPVGGTAPYIYLWTPGNQTNATATGLSANSYTVVVTDAHGCTATATVTVTQPSAVMATIVGNTPVTCFGQANGSATVAAAGGTGPYTYLWTPSNITNGAATGLSAGSYTVTVTDANGCVAQAITVITQPPLLTATMGIPTNVSCNGGNNGSATVTAAGGTPGYVYAWTPAGGTNAMGTGLSAGTYTCIVTDANGCTATSIVIISQPLALVASIGNVINVSCNGQTDGSALGSATGGTLAYSYLWTPGGTTAAATGMSAGTYSFVTTDANGCTSTATVTITQPAVLATTLTPTNILCAGGNNGSIATATTGGTIPYRYSWSNGQTTSDATVLTAGTYSVTVTDANNCTTTASVTLTEPALLSITANGPQTDCSGAPAQLNSSATGGTQPYVYAWTPSGGSNANTTVYPVSTTTFTVTVTDADGCTAFATVSIVVSAPLSLTVSGRTSVCPGGTITMSANASGGDGIYTYVWLAGGETSQSVTFMPTGDTTISVELTDGCKSAMQTAVIPITVDPVPAISFSSDITNGCNPLCIQFRDMTTIPSGGFSQFGWSFGDRDSNYTSSPIHCYNDTGTFNVSLTVTSDSGCSSTYKKVGMITVYSSPVAAFTYAPNPVNILSPQVQFTDQSTGKYPIVQWYWRFGTGDSTSELQNPTHNYTDTGTFCPTLTVVDMHGCIDSITNCLVVNPSFTFYIPDAFTPNGDGINDVFMPKGNYVSSYEMYIFDRWGEQLFHSTQMENGWNGTGKGGSVMCQQDTYVYMIKVTDTQGNQHSYTGKVTLLN